MRAVVMGEKQTRLIEVDVEVVPLNELHAGTVCVAGGRLERIVGIDRTFRATVVQVQLHDGTVDVQVFGDPSCPFLVLREAAV